MRNPIKALWQKLDGTDARRTDYLRKDREQREKRLERRGMTWLRDKYRKWEKAGKPSEEMLAELEERAEMRPEIADAATAEEASLAQAASGEAVADFHAFTDPSHLPVKPPKRKKGELHPAERGGFTPTAEEYMGERLPHYLGENDEEGKQRWRELKKAERELEKAEKKRAKRKGPAVCQPLRAFEKGHTWYKIPGQPEWECVECGKNVPTMRADLRRGVLVPIQGLSADRNLRGAVASLVSGRQAFLKLGGEPPKSVQEVRERITELPEAERALVAAEVFGLPGDVSLERTEVYEEHPGDYDVCVHCGMSKASHHQEEYEERYDDTWPGAVIGIRVVTKYWCPRHGVDAT